MLWVVSQRLIAKHGFVDTLFPPLPDANGTVPAGDFYRPAEYTADGARKPLVPRHGNSLIVQLVLDGKLNTPGVLAPYSKEICDPIREILEQQGMGLIERVL